MDTYSNTDVRKSLLVRCAAYGCRAIITSHFADGRKGTDGREVSCKGRRAVEAASVLSIDADMGCSNSVRLQKNRSKQVGELG